MAQKHDEVASRAWPSGLIVYSTNLCASSLFSLSAMTAMEIDQKMPPCLGMSQSRFGCSAARLAVSHSPPPTSTSTSPVASAVCEATTSPTLLAWSLSSNSRSRILGRFSMEMSAVSMPCSRATMPISGR